MATRILIVGFDALDHALMQRWADMGRLPTFARLLRTATWGETQNPPAMYSGSVWPSFSTGVSPARHGRVYRYQISSGDYSERYVSPAAVRTTTFWETLGAAGREVAIFDVPHSRLSPHLHGLQLVDWSTHEPDVVAGCSSPATLVGQLRQRFGQPRPDRCDRIAPTRTNVLALTDELRARIDNKLRVSLGCLTERNWDLFTVVFCESHCVGHQCWSMHDVTHPAHDAELAAAVGDPIAIIYQALDAALGRLIEAAGNDTFVLVLASHGMGPEYNESAVLDDVLRCLEGVPALRPGALQRSLQARARRLPRALRELAAVRAGRTRAHQWLHTRMLRHDRMRRAYFNVPHNHNAGAIRINLMGREHHGTVHPGAELRTLHERLREDLCQLVNPATGRTVVERVLFTADSFTGPFLHELPDAFVEWSRSEPVTAIGSPRLGWFQLPRFTQRTGDHSAAGLLFARAPWLPAARLSTAVPITALAPTVTHLLGVPFKDADHQPVAELVTGHTLATRSSKQMEGGALRRRIRQRERD